MDLLDSELFRSLSTQSIPARQVPAATRSEHARPPAQTTTARTPHPADTGRVDSTRFPGTPDPPDVTDLAGPSGVSGTAGYLDEHVRAEPSPAMRPYVAWYSGYRQRGVPAARHRGLPSPYLTLIFTLDEPLTISGHPDPRQRPECYDTLLGGLHTSPVTITHAGAQSGIQVAMRPLGTRAVLGLPAGELAIADLPADVVLGGLAEQVRERIRRAPDWPRRFAALDGLLLGAARRERSTAAEAAPEIRWAWRAVLRSGGRMPASALADEVGWSGRHLASRFRAETGLTPKAAARVVRFDRTRRLLARRASRLLGPDGADRAAGGGLDLAGLAVEGGYFDQAHLAREFRALAGAAPSRWLAEEFRNVQVLGAPGEEV